MTDAALIAAELLGEHEERKPFRSIRDRHALENMDEAYDVQAAFVRSLCAKRGCGTAGYKIGLTSPRMQAMCGIPHPLGGRILDDRVYPSGARIPLSAHIRLGIECEIAVRLGADIGPGALPGSVAELAEAVAEIAPAFELIEDRNADYAALDMLSLVADNSWNAGVVLGDFQASWPDLATIEGVLSVNGAEADRGHGRDVLGHPFEPVLWLARHLARSGEALRAGEIIMTGSFVPTRFPEAGQRYRFTLAGLGAVEAEITN